MGVGEEVIDRGILEAYIDRGNFLAGLGLLDQASSLAEELERLPLGVSAHRRMLADLSWLRGKIDLAKRRWMRSLVWTACACLRRPSFLLNLARAVPRRLLGAPTPGPGGPA